MGFTTPEHEEVEVIEPVPQPLIAPEPEPVAVPEREEEKVTR